MKLIVYEKDGCCESIQMECTPEEALILNHAMRRYVDDDGILEENLIIMGQMLEVKPIFREIGTESENKE